METTLKAVAELVHSALYPNAESAPVKLQELIEAAKNSYAGIVWESFLNDQDRERRVPENLLRQYIYEVKEDKDEGDMKYIDLGPIDIVDLPRDEGVYIVQPFGSRERLRKSTKSASNLFEPSLTGEHTYYRVGKKIYFPEGYLHDERLNKIKLTAVTIEPDLDGKIKIERRYAELIEHRLRQKYGPTATRPADKVSDNNPNAAV